MPAAPADHEHVCLVYADRPELQRHLVGFVQRGLKTDHTVVFVHHFGDDDEALAFLHVSGLPIRDLVDQRLVLVSHRRLAFEAGGSMIDYHHVAGLVSNLLQESERKGRAGLRIFADAAAAYIQEGRETEWFAFETWLGQRLHHRAGLVCAYPSRLLLRSQTRQKTAETHLGGISPDELPTEA